MDIFPENRDCGFGAIGTTDTCAPRRVFWGTVDRAAQSSKLSCYRRAGNLSF
jgi:hypothetical protein